MQILKAAANVFRTKGFHAARTEEICAVAGLSAGTVFRYFRDKEEIIATIAEMEFETYHEMTASMFSHEGFLAIANIDGKELEKMIAPTGLGLGLGSWLELYRSAKFAAAYRAKDEAMRAQLADALRAGQAAGWVRPDRDADEAAQLLSTLFSGIMVEYQLTPETNLEMLAAGLRNFVCAYILADHQHSAAHG